jgi:hypothetical protein
MKLVGPAESRLSDVKRTSQIGTWRLQLARSAGHFAADFAPHKLLTPLTAKCGAKVLIPRFEPWT